MDDGLVVAEGVVVNLEYTLQVNGEVVDSTSFEGREPIQFLQGFGEIIPGLERALDGMEVGERKRVRLTPVDGYGDIDPEAFEVLSRDEFPSSIPLDIGTEIELRDEEDEILVGSIISMEGEEVTMDFNHPLAGKELEFEIKVVSLRAATKEEIEHGHIHEAEDH